MKHKVIGIDLGTTYSCVAVWDEEKGTSEVIPDYAGNKTTPSVVGIDPQTHKVIAGRVAKNNAGQDPRNTILEIKREMGELAKKAYAGEPDQPFRVEFSGQPMLPQEISAFILMKMKAIAESAIGEEIRDAVITVPAYFTANQKKATEHAAYLAGLHPRQLIPEPTAAAICYGLDTLDPQRKTYLVYDLGGGTFDVSIIRVQEAKIDVIATSGDRRLGGGDFDNLITHWALDECRKRGLDVTRDPLAQPRIKLLAEDAKKRLASALETTLVVTVAGRAETLVLTRKQLEDLIEPLLRRSINEVVRALGYAAENGVTREEVDAIILVGGSTKIPRVKTMLLDHFRRDAAFIQDDADPDLVVARGAAMLARGYMASPPPFDIRHKPDSSLVDAEALSAMDIGLITEHSLGVGVQQGIFSSLIERGTAIPTSSTKEYTNPEGAVTLDALIFQGEGEYVQQNTHIGTVTLGPMQALPAESHRFEVTFTLDQNGVLSVVVNHVNEGKTYTGNFSHRSTLAGDDALMARRDQLVPLFLADVDPPRTYTPDPPPPPPAIQQPGSDASSTQASPATAASGATAEDALEAVAIPQIGREVPEEFKRLVRKAEKQLHRVADPRLLAAFTAFAKAIEGRANADELDELGDALEDSYDDARRTS